MRYDWEGKAAWWKVALGSRLSWYGYNQNERWQPYHEEYQGFLEKTVHLFDRSDVPDVHAYQFSRTHY